MAELYRLTLIRFLRGKRSWVGVLGAGVALALVIGVNMQRSAGNKGESLLFADVIKQSVFGFLIYLLPFVFGSSLFAEEIENRTLGFLLTRPVTRLGVLAAKFGAGLTWVWGILTLVFMLLLLAVTMGRWFGWSQEMPAWNDVGLMFVSMLLLSAVYTALAFLWGIGLPDAAGIICIAHFGILEYGINQMPSVLRCLSAAYYGERVSGFPVEGWMPDSVPMVGRMVSFSVLGVLLLALFSLLFLMIQTTETDRPS